MPIDNYTILVSSSAALVFLGIALLHFWNKERDATWLLWWAAPFIAGGLGAVGYMRPDWQTNVVAISLGNALRIAAVCLLWQGARAFEGRRVLWWTVPATAAAWLALCLVPSFVTSLPSRVIGVSLFNALFCLLAARELWTGRRREDLPSRRAAVFTFVSFAVVMAVRIVAIDLLPFPMGALPLDPTWMALFNLAVFVHATFLAFLLIAITKERREAEQRQYALLDPLTGLMNRRAFMGLIERHARRPRLGSSSTGLLVLDLDHFKSVNDRFGHEVGDRVLKAFAAVAEASVRPTDQLYRMGGEEFCFILPDTEVAEAIGIAERIRGSVAQIAVEAGRAWASATVSIGVATSERSGASLEVLYAAADAAAYQAKANGRDCVVVADVGTLRAALPPVAERRLSA